MTVDEVQKEEFELRKRSSLGQVLMKAARLLNEQAIDRVRARTEQDLRPAHTAVFPHIDLEGTRLTVLAARMGMSKQAVGQLVGELEAMEVVERVPDPSDGRAKLVRFCQRDGKLVLFEGLAVLIEFEAELAEQLGRERIDALHAQLTALLDVLEAPQSLTKK
ncbi:MAG: MarR family winged helix-turn-helix transcriptional regulator [Nannocystaceae bacterium]|nr:MarR family transcriptional regulator [bacterium]